MCNACDAIGGLVNAWRIEVHSSQLRQPVCNPVRRVLSSLDDRADHHAALNAARTVDLRQDHASIVGVA
jgi:hypothetical protein